jgi:pimeloyl-ACP methyl ester carboxylesterase
MWAPNIDALAEHFHVFAMDLWGFGYSSREPMDYSYQLFADQVLGFMDALGIERASIIGQSMGGGTAMLFCIQHRDRVDKLVLVGAAGMPGDLPLAAKFLTFSGVGKFLMGLKTNSLRKKTLADFWIHRRENLTDEYCETATRSHKVEGSGQARLSILRKKIFFTLGEEIPKLAAMDVPILLVWGAEDKSVPLETGRKLHALLPGTRLEVFEHTGHVPNYEEADRFNKLAVEFLKQT